MRPAAWAGMESLESRLLLSGYLVVYGAPDLSTVISNGDTTPGLSDSTDFGPAGVTSGEVRHTFRLRNVGDSPLNFTGDRAAVGNDTGDFTLSVGPPETIDPGAWVTIEVVFDPTDAGTRHATVTLTSDDSIDPAYSFDVQGSGLNTVVLEDGLQYAVTTPGTGATVAPGDNLLVHYTGWLLDGTQFDSSRDPGRLPFAVDDIGSANVIAGWNEGLIGMQVGEQRTLIVPPDLGYGDQGMAPSIPPGATLIFDVELLSANSPLQVRGGDGYGQVIYDQQVPTSQADHTDFGSAALTGATAQWTFALFNTDSVPHNLLGDTPVVIGGTHADEFTVVAQPAATIPAATGGVPGVLEFTLRFDPSDLGVRTATVTLLSDDPREEAYTFDIQGTGTPDRIPGLDTVTLPDGLQYAILTPGTGSTVYAGANVLVHYTGALLDGTQFDSSRDPGRYPFPVSAVGYASVIAGWNEGLIGMKVGETRKLIIPPSLGYGPAGMDPDIPPNATLVFDVELLSMDSPVQMRGGTGYGYLIYDQQAPTLLADHTDFGNVALSGATAQWDFAIANSAYSSFNLLGTPQVVISGPNASDFTVVSQPPATVPGAQGTGLGVAPFTLQFDPGALGARTATVTVTTDNPNEGAYSFQVQGTGVPNRLSGAKEDKAFTISFAALYQATHGAAPPAGALAFVVQSVAGGRLTKGGVAVTAGTTLIGPGQSLVWTPPANANHTQNAFAVQEWDGSQAVGEAMPIRVEVAPAEDAPAGTPPDVILRPGVDAQSRTIDLNSIFSDPDVTGQVLQFLTSKGTFYVGTFANAPTNAANILSYVSEGAYSYSVFHNVTPGSLVQGGGYSLDTEGQLGYIEQNAGVDTEYGYSNVRGTVSVVRKDWMYNGDASWFAFNLADNSGPRDGDYTAFGEVMGTGMSVLDAIAKLPREDLSANLNEDFASVPVDNNNWTVIGEVNVVPALAYKVTSSSSAVAAISLTGSSLTLNIPAGASGSATITVTATDVTGKSTTKTFRVVLPVVTVTAADAAAAETALGKTANPGTFRISRTGATTSGLTVQYTLGGMAANGDDYASLTGSVTIPAGQGSVLVTVGPVDDAIVEAKESVVLTLTDSDSLLYRVGAAASASVTISDNDLTTVGLSAPQPDASETSPATNMGVFRFTRADVTADPLTVKFSRGGSAKSGTDYFLRVAGSLVPLTANTVTIPANQASVDVELVAIDDALGEGPETAVLTLQSGGYLIGTAAGTVTIEDNEPAVSLAASDPSAAEPNDPGAFTITRTGSTAQPLTVLLKRGGTAVSGSDYVAIAASVVIPAGAAWADLAAQPLADTIGEADESAILTLSANTAYSLAPLPADRTATVMIADGAKDPGADLVLLSLSYTGKTYSLAALAGKTLALSAQVRDQGLLGLGPFTVTFVLSTDRQLGNGDDVGLASASLAGLAAGATATASRTASMGSLAGLGAGAYFVFARIDLPSGNVLLSPLNNIVITA